MKRVISVLCALVILTAGAFAQNPGQRRGGDNGWRERVRSEKVAFLTEEIDLTESEAQVFWPIYNQIQKEQRDNFEAVRKAYDAMAKGVQEGKSEKEMWLKLIALNMRVALNGMVVVNVKWKFMQKRLKMVLIFFSLKFPVMNIGEGNTILCPG